MEGALRERYRKQMRTSDERFPDRFPLLFGCRRERVSNSVSYLQLTGPLYSIPGSRSWKVHQHGHLSSPLSSAPAPYLYGLRNREGLEPQKKLRRAQSCIILPSLLSFSNNGNGMVISPSSAQRDLFVLRTARNDRCDILRVLVILTYDAMIRISRRYTYRAEKTHARATSALVSKTILDYGFRLDTGVFPILPQGPPVLHGLLL